MASLRNNLICTLILLPSFFSAEFVRAKSEEEKEMLAELAASGPKIIIPPKASMEDLKKMNNKLVVIDSQIRDLVVSATCIEDDSEATPQQKIIYTKIENLLKEGRILYLEMDLKSAELSGKTRTLNRQKDLLQQFSDWGLRQQTFSDPRVDTINTDLNARIASLSAKLKGADPTTTVLIQDEMQRAQCDAQDSIKKYSEELNSAAVNPFGNLNYFIKKRSNVYSNSGLEWIKLTVCNPNYDSFAALNSSPEIPCYKNDLQEKIQKAINIMYPVKKNTAPPKNRGSSSTEAGFSENQRNQNQAPGSFNNREGAYGTPDGMGRGGPFPGGEYGPSYPNNSSVPRGTR